jgi:hypothetical protein
MIKDLENIGDLAVTEPFLFYGEDLSKKSSQA